MMRYIITDFKKAEKGKIELCFNENITLWLYQGEARELSLAKGVELSEDEYQNLLHEVIGKRAVKRAMHLLERQERTERQLREKLMRNRYPQEAGKIRPVILSKSGNKSIGNIIPESIMEGRNTNCAIIVNFA